MEQDLLAPAQLEEGWDPAAAGSAADQVDLMGAGRALTAFGGPIGWVIRPI